MKKLILLVLVLTLGLVFGCKKEENNTGIDIEQRKTDFITEYSYYEDEANVPDRWKDWFDYSYFKSQIDKRVFITLTFEEVKAKIENKETFVIYYGFNPELYQCPNCAITIPHVVDVALELGIDVYYLDIRTMRVNDDDNYKYLFNKLKEELADFPDLIRASTYVNYKDGVATGFKEGSLKDEEGNNILRVLTDAEIEELKNIYRSYFCK